MKKKNRGDMPVGKLTRVDDFLPPPDKLVVPEDTVRVTLDLTLRSVNFFKKEAKRNHTKYQRMIRTIVDRYAFHYQQL